MIRPIQKSEPVETPDLFLAVLTLLAELQQEAHAEVGQAKAGALRTAHTRSVLQSKSGRAQTEVSAEA